MVASLGAPVAVTQNKPIFGFGTSTHRSREAELGGGGKSANASGWLCTAAEAGCEAPLSGYGTTDHHILAAGRYTVIGRSGPKVRGEHPVSAMIRRERLCTAPNWTVSPTMYKIHVGSAVDLEGSCHISG